MQAVAKGTIISRLTTMTVLTAIMTISQRFSICKPGSGPLSVLVAVVLGVGDEVVLGSREQREGEAREREREIVQQISSQCT